MDTRLIYVYDSCGTLVNGKPFVGIEQFKKFIHSLFSEKCNDDFKQNMVIKALSNCRPNGDFFIKHYFRTRPTTVFKSAVKFYRLKTK